MIGETLVTCATSLTARSLACLLGVVAKLLLLASPLCAQVAGEPQAKLDEQQLAARGIRVLRGAHIELLTDVPSSPAVDELPAVFDAAVPQWRTLFGLPEKATVGWRRRAYLMADRKVFEAAGVLPDDLPEFPNGYTFRDAIFMLDVKNDYYRRHLFLHEGTHLTQFMLARPHVAQWFSEGLAEVLGTHRWKDGKLELGVYPSAPDEFPRWGRIEILRDETKRGRTHALEDLRGWEPRRFAKNDAYAWCWATVAVLRDHPRYRDATAKLLTKSRDADLDAALAKLTPTLRDDLAIFAQEATYAYDWDRNAVDFRDGRPFPPNIDRAARPSPPTRAGNRAGSASKPARPTT
ncbi:MAG: hypothetical protein QM811_24990 [Pirellulales bacterium]